MFKTSDVILFERQIVNVTDSLEGLMDQSQCSHLAPDWADLDLMPRETVELAEMVKA
tara:strand:- start:888 stop:1058 length:171 start_codon:yes stop_codon:yes gene_type:complete